MHLFMLATSAIIISAPIVLWTWLGGTLMPILTALITHVNAPPLLKALINALLAVAVSLVSYALLHNGSFDVLHWLFYAGNALFLAWASYAGLWRQTAVRAIEENLPNGIGAPPNSRVV